MIHSDLHIHSEYSYDAILPLSTIVAVAEERGYRQVGVTDHYNLNNNKFRHHIEGSAKYVKRMQKDHPTLLLGVELTPIAKPLYDYYTTHPEMKGYEPEGFTYPTSGVPIPYQFEMAASKEELMALGVQYAVAAAHGYIDSPVCSFRDMKENIDAWHRMQMYLATDERTTILGHPYYHGLALWYEDFSVIPYSMHEELAAALKENGKYVEMNRDMLNSRDTSEKFRHQYAEFMRFMFEKGVRVTYGSDKHGGYLSDHRSRICPYLEAAGFRDGDFSELSPEDLWQ